MKICYLADARSVHTQRWVKHFADKGHQVELISYRPYETGNIDNVKLHVFTPARPQIRILGYFINLASTIYEIRKLINTLKPDIVHAHYIINYGLLGAISNFHPLIISAWGSDVLVAPEKSKMVKLTVKFALAKADIVLTTSEYLKAYLSSQFKLPNSKIVALPWGINLKVFTKDYEAEARSLRASLGINSGDFVILSPRHLTDHYRIENILQAMPYIITRDSKVTLVVLKGAAEDRQFEDRINRLIEHLGISQNIRLVRRHLSSHDMAVLYNICDAFVSIPKSDQFASTIQEGMACGTIPIVGNLEVYRQYLTDGDNALLVDSDDPKDIATKIIYCIEHPELKHRCYNINRKIIEEKEDWEKNATKLEELYQGLLLLRKVD